MKRHNTLGGWSVSPGVDCAKDGTLGSAASGIWSGPLVGIHFKWNAIWCQKKSICCCFSPGCLRFVMWTSNSDPQSLQLWATEMIRNFKMENDLKHWRESKQTKVLLMKDTFVFINMMQKLCVPCGVSLIPNLPYAPIPVYICHMPPFLFLFVT